MMSRQTLNHQMSLKAGEAAKFGFINKSFITYSMEIIENILNAVWI